MADTRSINSAPAKRRSLPRSPQAWIRRRARRLARAYNLSRREAVKNAIIDWTHFHPLALPSAVVRHG